MTQQSSDLVMVEREVREKIAQYREMGGKIIYSGEHVANILEHWIDRLSALQSVEGGVQGAAKQESCPESAPRTETDVRWAVNYLLEQIAAKFEAWDTMDLWRSDAANLVRSFKHDLTKTPSADHDAGNLRGLAEQPPPATVRNLRREGLLPITPPWRNGWLTKFGSSTLAGMARSSFEAMRRIATT